LYGNIDIIIVMARFRLRDRLADGRNKRGCDMRLTVAA
jgi:hypothetical protein